MQRTSHDVTQSFVTWITLDRIWFPFSLRLMQWVLDVIIIILQNYQFKVRLCTSSDLSCRVSCVYIGENLCQLFHLNENLSAFSLLKHFHKTVYHHHHHHHQHCYRHLHSISEFIEKIFFRNTYFKRKWQKTTSAMTRKMEEIR